MVDSVVDHDVDIGELRLRNGGLLPAVTQRVTVYGTPRDGGANVVFAPHALTGSSRVLEWWAGIAGPGRLFDPARWCIVGINALGGCYGSTGPSSRAPDGRQWGPRFPIVAVEDMVDAQHRALRALGIERVSVVVGGSLGGFQALAWARRHSALIDHAIVIGAHFRDGWYDEPPIEGLRLARAIATLTYKSEALFERRFANRPDRGGGDPAQRMDDRFDVDGYLAYQGVRFSERMDANTYRTLTRAMDLFDLRDAEAPAASPRLTFVGITGDQLFFPEHIDAVAQRWAAAGWNATFRLMQSDHGHDAFLAEGDRVGDLLRDAVG